MTATSTTDTKRKSHGGLYLAVGLFILLISGLLASMPGGFWEMLLISFCFNIVGLVKAEGWLRRLAGVLLVGISGGLCLQDFLIWWAGR